jgi:catechol 2,3-dioxygenase-like lactoylglutathione lyase family enzyme
MRIDHIALRTHDRKKTTQFFIDALGYKIQEEFTIDFGEGKYAQCIALEPPEKMPGNPPWVVQEVFYNSVPKGSNETVKDMLQEYHLPPEIFVSDGNPGSIVGDWVAKRDGVGGIHHIAYMVDDVEAKMKEWQEKGYAEFSTDAPLTCPGLTQVFTKPSVLTGVIYEFIKREKHGFCSSSVKNLMLATKGD